MIFAECGDREAQSTHSSSQRTLKIETTDTGIPFGNKEYLRSIYSIAFSLAHSIVSYSPDTDHTVRFSPNSLIQPFRN